VAEADFKKTPKGVKYAVLKPGSGAEAKNGMLAAVKYSGWLQDGTLFDASEKHGGAPFFFTLGKGGAIEGWQEGVRGMKVGEKRQLVIPPALAYGKEGTPGGPIPPDATLTFEVELADALEVPSAPAKVADSMYKTTPKGVKYAVLKPGSGEAAKDGQHVFVHYAGWLKNGKMFDRSFDHRGSAPLDFTLGEGRVIPGWEDGIRGMKVGERRQLVIPPALGYGAQGQPPDIPPNSTLIFSVQLMRME
jgi:FKBP-type peptidyl-prolyl cis-trans isomerase